MDKTIQGKSQKDIFFELSGILKLEDYKFKEDTTHQAYFPSATVFNKVRNLLGFNLETEAIPLPNGKLFDVTKECDQAVSYTHLDVYKRQVGNRCLYLPCKLRVGAAPLI